MPLFENAVLVWKERGIVSKMRLVPWDFLSSFSPSCSPSLADVLKEDPGVRQQWMREQMIPLSCL